MQSAGEFTALDFTLRRISSIEQGFNRLFVESQNEVQSSSANDFKEILDQASNSPKTSFEQKISTNKTTTSKPKEIEGLIEKYSKENNLDSDFVKALILQESGMNPDATSKCGAMGLMQLMPGTAKGLGVANAYDPEENIKGGTKYLKSMMNRFNQNPELALAAYNAGPGAVSKYGGIPPYRETQNYVKNVMANWENLKK